MWVLLQGTFVARAHVCVRLSGLEMPTTSLQRDASPCLDSSVSLRSSGRSQNRLLVSRSHCGGATMLGGNVSERSLARFALLFGWTTLLGSNTLDAQGRDSCAMPRCRRGTLALAHPTSPSSATTASAQPEMQRMPARARGLGTQQCSTTTMTPGHTQSIQEWPELRKEGAWAGPGKVPRCRTMKPVSPTGAREHRHGREPTELCALEPAHACHSNTPTSIIQRCHGAASLRELLIPQLSSLRELSCVCVCV